MSVKRVFVFAIFVENLPSRIMFTLKKITHYWHGISYFHMCFVHILIKSSSFKCWSSGMSALAARAPLAATAGTPMPGLVLSPQRYNPGKGVDWPGNVPFPAAMAGPYVPWDRRLNRAWVNGDPTRVTRARARTWGKRGERGGGERGEREVREVGARTWGKNNTSGERR